jgi:hydroxypyruvate reductase
MTPRPRLLQTLPLQPALETRLQRDYDIVRLPAPPEQPAFLAREAAGIVGIVTSAAVGANAALIEALPALKVISSFGVGLDQIDLAAAAKLGVPVGYTPDVLNDCVADLAIALMLAVARGVASGDRFVRRGDWSGPPAISRFPLGRKVSGARLGILGLGRIGRTVARRAEGFDMSVRYHNRRPVPDVPYAHEPSLKALASWADYLVVIAAGGAETRHLVNAEILDALGPQGFLINVARGSVIDEAALVQALQQGRIAGAGLDVFDKEPQVPSELFALDNVVLLPHIASATVETRHAMGERVADNLDAWFRDGRLVSAAPLP